MCFTLRGAWKSRSLDYAGSLASQRSGFARDDKFRVDRTEFQICPLFENREEPATSEVEGVGHPHRMTIKMHHYRNLAEKIPTLSQSTRLGWGTRGQGLFAGEGARATRFVSGILAPQAQNATLRKNLVNRQKLRDRGYVVAASRNIFIAIVSYSSIAD
jgi:hypothetical protein